MINFRFHLISLIAVFLALALGVVMGYGVLGQPTVDTLQHRIDTVEGRANRVRGENDELRQENKRLEESMKAIDDFATTRRLDGTTAVPVAVRGIDENLATEFVQLARRGGAAVPGIVWLEQKWGLENAADVSELAAIIGSTATNRAIVRDAASRALATRLSSGPVSGRPDLLAELEAANFIATQDVDGVRFDPATLEGRGGRVMAIGGTDASLTPEQSTTPLARALVTIGTPVIVADAWKETEGGPERGAALDGIRGDNTLASAVSTLDAFDTVDGPIVAVLTLGARIQGTIGHYGFGRGADRAVPEWWIV